MNQIDLCNKIKNNLEDLGIDVSDMEINDLYRHTMRIIDNMLDDELSVDFSNFGSFWRKKGPDSSLTFFEPANEFQISLNKSR